MINGGIAAGCGVGNKSVGLPEPDGLHPKETTIAMALELLE